MCAITTGTSGNDTASSSIDQEREDRMSGMDQYRQAAAGAEEFHERMHRGSFGR